jgi:hypothetical protein
MATLVLALESGLFHRYLMGILSLHGFNLSCIVDSAAIYTMVRKV